MTYRHPQDHGLRRLFVVTLAWLLLPAAYVIAFLRGERHPGHGGVAGRNGR